MCEIFGLPEGVVGRDWHPIRIVTEGPDPDVDEQRAKRIRHRIQNRFESIVSEFEPDYGAILSYKALPTVFELNRSESIESDYVFVHRRIVPPERISADNSHETFVRKTEISGGTILEIRDHASPGIRSQIRTCLSNQIVEML